MKITVLLFAKLKELWGKEQLAMELPRGTTAQDAVTQLFKENGVLHNEKYALHANHHLLLAVNQNYIQPETVLKDGDELALIPPVSGG